MYKRSGTLLAIAALFFTIAAVDLNAGQRTFDQHQVNKRTHVKHVRVINKRIVVINIDRRHRHHRPHGVYSGDVAVYYRRNVGTWSYGGVGRPAMTVIEQPNAKIIDIDKLGGKTECSMEAGVCVIRP